MDMRHNDLSQLQSYIEGIDKEVTMILQNLQWDRKHLLEGTSMVACKYDAGHKIPPDKRQDHENDCFLKNQGYTKEDKMLPDPFDPDAATLVKFNNESIKEILIKASENDPSFKKGRGWQAPQPLSLFRLQAAYSSDERRAIHDAVVAAVPSCHDLADLALSSEEGGDKKSGVKSRLQVLAELRDMKRRRARYRTRGAARSRNYSLVLRDVIATQMEMYSETQVKVEPQHDSSKHGHPSDSRMSGDLRNSHKTHNIEYSGERRRDNSVSRRMRREDAPYNNYKREDRGRHSKSTSEYVDDHNGRNDKNDYDKKKHGERSKRQKDEYKEEKGRYSGYKDKRRRPDEHEVSNKRDDHYKDRSKKRYNEYYESGNEKYESSSRDKKIHSKRYDYGNKDYRDDRKAKRTDSSNREEGYRRYYDTVKVKEEPEDFS